MKMSQDQVLWSLLHIESKTQFDSLTYAQTALLVSTFNEREWTNWAAWHEGLPDWQLLEELLNMLNVKRAPPVPVVHQKPPPFLAVAVAAAPVVPPTLPESAPSVHEPAFASAETALTHTGPNVLVSDGRMSKRFSKRYKAVILAKGKMFETLTVDLSLAGLQVADSLPPGNDGHLEVTLVNSKNEQLQLICSLVPDEKRTRMKIVRAGKLDQLQAWLLAP